MKEIARSEPAGPRKIAVPDDAGARFVQEILSTLDPELQTLLSGMNFEETWNVLLSGSHYTPGSRNFIDIKLPLPDDPRWHYEIRLLLPAPVDTLHKTYDASLNSEKTERLFRGFSIVEGKFTCNFIRADSFKTGSIGHELALIELSSKTSSDPRALLGQGRVEPCFDQQEFRTTCMQMNDLANALFALAKEHRSKKPLQITTDVPEKLRLLLVPPQAKAE